jgi:uncharacterized protein (DUF849 family)
MTSREPAMIAVAPTGARKTKADHGALPIDASEIAACASECCAEGASLLHLHVRDRNGRHVLDAEAYRDATRAIRDAVGDRIVIQATTEANGAYPAPAQIDLVRDLRPEAVSLSIRELVPDDASEADAARFFAWLRAERIWAQYIVYTAEELARFFALRRRGIVPDPRPSVLLVLGRYAADQRSSPRDLLPFFRVLEDDIDWAACAFGSNEYTAMLTAIALGGGARVGFENNLLLADGSVAPSNAALVAQLAAGVSTIGRRPATAAELRDRCVW